jgi:hypothetical protein
MGLKSKIKKHRLKLIIAVLVIGLFVLLWKKKAIVDNKYSKAKLEMLKALMDKDYDKAKSVLDTLR